MPNIETIFSYHAHIYYHDERKRAKAAKLRKSLRAIPDIRLGRWRDEPEGPHPAPIYQAGFPWNCFRPLCPG